MWITAEILKDDFLYEYATLQDAASPNTSDLELAARFMNHVAFKIQDNDRTSSVHVRLLLDVFKFFTESYLAANDIHSVASAYDPEIRKLILASYFKAFSALEERDGVTKPPSSALLRDAASSKTSIFGLFGGQGVNEVCFDELQSLYDIYKPFIVTFLETMIREVLEPFAMKENTTAYYRHGFDVITWLSNSALRPPVHYLASIPISFPLIGLTQLVQYLITCRVAGMNPGDMRNILSGATGHSQGIVSAVAIAASESFEDFTANAIKALKWLFYSGLRGQQAFPVVSLDPRIVQDSVEGGEGMPSPMLLITGLRLTELEPHLHKTNSYLEQGSQIHVSLHNGPRAFVVTGPPKSLFGLVTSLRKVRAAPGADQSKIPFSQRKPTFFVRFLPVGVPYHSEYLQGATDSVLRDLEGEELWQASDLKISVFNTEDGKFDFHPRNISCTTRCFRFRLARTQDFDHSFPMRPGLYFTSSLDEGNKFPGNSHTCY